MVEAPGHARLPLGPQPFRLHSDALTFPARKLAVSKLASDPLPTYLCFPQLLMASPEALDGIQTRTHPGDAC